MYMRSALRIGFVQIWVRVDAGSPGVTGDPQNYVLPAHIRTQPSE